MSRVAVISENNISMGAHFAIRCADRRFWSVSLYLIEGLPSLAGIPATCVMDDFGNLCEVAR